jgi:hypothetical protein
MVIVSYSHGQTNCVISTPITKDYLYTGNLTLSNASVGNNFTVKIVAQQITINPPFSIGAGANVTIEAMASPVLRSDSYYEELSEKEVTTSLETLELESAIKSIKVYTITGQIVYFSETNTDIYSIGLNQGVYIIQKEYNSGNVVKEKVIRK